MAAALYTLYQKARAHRHQQQTGTAGGTSTEAIAGTSDEEDPSAQLLKTAFELMQCTTSAANHHAASVADGGDVVLEDDFLYVAGTATTTRTPSQQQQDTEETFCQAVREEWWNAVYGPDFLVSPSSSSSSSSSPQTFHNVPHHGTGLSGIRYYTAYEATIPASRNGNKVGVTISRLPLGLYVRSIQPGSEAALTGIPVKSVLVSINGIPLLAEPSRHALERLWLYEGYFRGSSSSDDDTTTKMISAFPTTTDELKLNTPTSTTATTADDIARMVHEPVVLQLIHQGKLFHVTLLSNPPWGITWAPCGNFPLVKRVYSFAADAGVQKGSLVAAVNDRSVRDMDHEDAALYLRELFEN